MCHGSLCDLPGCSYRPGSGIGLRKAHPAVKGDTPREAAYRRGHPVCEAVLGCFKTPRLHHVDRRQNRATSRLLMVCDDHHDLIHRGLLDDGRKSA